MSPSWPTVPLADLAAAEPNSIVDGPFGSDLKASEYVYSGVPLIRIQNVKPNQFLSKDIRFISERKANDLARHDYRPGDVVITKLGDPCGVACIVPQEAGNGIIVADIVRFRGDHKRIDHRFLTHFINSPTAIGLIHREAKGTTRQRVNLSNFKRLLVPVPPLPEQRRIAEILDRAEALRAKRRAALAQLDTLTQAIFLDLFGDQLTVFQKWPTKKLGDVLDFLTSGSRGWAAHYSHSGELFLRIQNVGRDELNLDEIAYVNAPDSAEAKRTRVKPGDVLLSITADLGRTAVVPEGIGSAYINQHLSILRTKVVVPRFLSAYLASPAGQRQVLLRNRQGVKAGLNFDDIRSLVIPLPPLELQHQFAARVNSVEKLKTALCLSLAQVDAFFASLQHRAFRGEL